MIHFDLEKYLAGLKAKGLQLAEDDLQWLTQYTADWLKESVDSIPFVGGLLVKEVEDGEAQLLKIEDAIDGVIGQ